MPGSVLDFARASYYFMIKERLEDIAMRSSFIFGHQGRPSLTKTVCNRTPYSHKNPTRSWFKHIIDLPYGGWGFYARLHCHTYMELAPVFNFAVVDFSSVAHKQHHYMPLAA